MLVRWGAAAGRRTRVPSSSSSSARRRGRFRARSGRRDSRRRSGMPRWVRISSIARAASSCLGRATARRRAGGRSSAGANLSLSTKHRAEDREVVQPDPFGRVRRVEGALLLGEQLAYRLRRRRRPCTAVPGSALHRSRADVSARHRVDLDPEVLRARAVAGSSAGYDGPQLDHRVVSLPLHAPSPNHHTALVEPQVRRVEEVDLADLAVQRIHP